MHRMHQSSVTEAHTQALTAMPYSCKAGIMRLMTCICACVAELLPSSLAL